VTGVKVEGEGMGLWVAAAFAGKVASAVAVVFAVAAVFVGAAVSAGAVGAEALLRPAEVATSEEEQGAAVGVRVEADVVVPRVMVQALMANAVRQLATGLPAALESTKLSMNFWQREP